MEIRPYEQRDDEAIDALCIVNAGRKFGADPVDARLAPLFYLKSYVGLEPESCFVAYSGDVLAGYVAAVSDVRKLSRYESQNRLRRERAVLRQLTIAWSQGELSTRVLIRRQLRRLVEMVDLVRPSCEDRLRAQGVDVERYPAHCHLQVNRNFASQGTGLKLMLRLRKHLKRSGVVGQHAIIREAEGAEGYGKMIEALGFKEVSREERVARNADGGRRWVHRALVAELAAKSRKAASQSAVKMSAEPMASP